MYYFLIQEPLAPAMMDVLLAQGYYRMRQTVFTTSATINDQGRVIEVLWARIRLPGYTPGRRHRELIRRNRHFSRVLLDAHIDDEIEDLYAAYRQHVDFDAPESAAAFLLGDSPVNHFPGRMWQVRDNGRLIAVGYFDEGADSAAGILNFYHPDYRKCSPGKWLYLESVRHAADTGKDFFYPGYIALDFPKFDYKLMAGRDRIELWDIRQAAWYPYTASLHARQAGHSAG